MASQDLPYFKFVAAIIESGIWAGMSSAARALYPVLLRFSDGHFKPVYPGSALLLKLTGFKQKSSLRKARRELVDLGLITVTEGTGRKNTFYSFRFDNIPLGVTTAHPTGTPERIPGGQQNTPVGDQGTPLTGGVEDSPYNKIHISINNNVQENQNEEPEGQGERFKFLIRRFGEETVNLARSECELAGLPPTHQNVQKILYRTGAKSDVSWTDMKNYLSGRISPGSLSVIEKALISVENGQFIFADSLPDYLKDLLSQICDHVFFEPSESITRKQFWNSAGADL